MGNKTTVTLYGCNYDLTEQRPTVTTTPFTELTGLVSTPLNCFHAKNTINVESEIKKFINDYELGTNKVRYGYDFKTEYTRKYIQKTAKQNLETMFPELKIIDENKYFWIYADMGIDFATTNVGQAVNITAGSLNDIDEYFTLELSMSKRKGGM
jgi:hypothetical protein